MVSNSLIISSSEENPELEWKAIAQLMGGRLDALVMASSGTDPQPIQRMERHGLPCVLIDREVPGMSANFVGINDEAAERMATEHLIEQGCRSVAHIRGRENSTGMRRFEGYKNALQRHGIPYSPSLVTTRSRVDINSTRMGADAMRMLLKEKPISDGVFAYDDPLAIGAIDEVLDAGLRIPEDIAINRMRQPSLRFVASRTPFQHRSEQSADRRTHCRNPAGHTRVEGPATAIERHPRAIPHCQSFIAPERENRQESKPFAFS